MPSLDSCNGVGTNVDTCQDSSNHHDISSQEHPHSAEAAKQKIASTRRDFVKQAAVVSAGLAAAAILPSHPSLAEPVASLGEARKKPSRNRPKQKTRPFAFPDTDASRERTLLDEGGRLRCAVPVKLYDNWKAELRGSSDSKLTPRQMAVIHLWVGEYELAKNEEPKKAGWHFRAARKLVTRNDSINGWAAYNIAVALFFENAYPAAARSFQELLKAKPRLTGFHRPTAAQWARRVQAVTARYNELDRMGIPRPPRLDPECGAGGLAACLQAHHLPFDRKKVLAATRMTGRGSSMQDLIDACPKLGVVGHPVAVRDEKAFRALPKPLVAHVERDHFVAVVAADADGVVYLCTDCGCWPGGRVKVTWEQWRAMRPGSLLCVVKPDTHEDRVLNLLVAQAKAGISNGDAAKNVQLAMGNSQAGGLSGVIQLSPLFQQLTGLVTTYMPVHTFCAIPTRGEHAPPDVSSPYDGDPVNLATGEEVHPSPPDLVVYNPFGPDVTLQRTYNSLKGYTAPDHGENFGFCWTHNYNIQIWDLDAGTPTEEPPIGIIYAAWDAPYGRATITGSNAPAGGNLVWEIYLNNNLVADSANPGGWDVYPGIGNAYPAEIVVSCGNYREPLGNGYTVRARCPDGRTGHEGETATFSGTFTVIERPTIPGIGEKQLVFPDGAKVIFNNASTPTPNQPVVTCSVAPGNGYAITLHFDANNTAGYYRVTHRDGTQWILSSARATLVWGGYYEVSVMAVYQLRRIVDKMGNSIRLHYDAGFVPNGEAGFVSFVLPLISHITSDATNATLLTFTRNSHQTITAATDCYGRSVHYSYGTYPTYGYLAFTPDNLQNLEEISQVVANGTTIFPMRWRYGYQYLTTSSEVLPNTSNNGIERAALLHTVTQPSPTGTGESTLTIDYEDYTCFVTRVTDPVGNVRLYSQLDANGDVIPLGDLGGSSNRTKVTLQDSSANTFSSRVAGFDENLSTTHNIDGAGNTKENRIFSDPVNPYRPSIVSDGNNRWWNQTWDEVGNLLTQTTPRGTVTTYEWANWTSTDPVTNQPVVHDFPLKRLRGIQEGTKAPTTFDYYEPSGMLRSVTGPLPDGGTGTTSFTYDSLGNITSITSPGNNASPQMVTVFNYTQDGAYSQPAKKGQPLTITDNLGRVTHFRYDTQGRAVLTVDANGQQTNFAYNVVGQLIGTRFPATMQTGSGRNQTDNDYLFPGGPLMNVNFFDESSTFVHQISYHYDAMRRLISTTGAAEDAAYQYDAAGRLSARYDGNGNCQSYYGYLDSGNVWYEAMPGQDPNDMDFVFRVFDYDPAGNMTARDEYFYNNSAVPTLSVRFSYADDEGLLSEITYPSDPGRDAVITYDEYGRRSQISDGTGSRDHTYNDSDALTGIATQYTGLSTMAIGYGYYPDGSRSQMTTPVGSYSYLYDAAGQLVSLTNPFSETFSWVYQLNGWLQKQTLPNGVESEYTHDAQGQITNLVNRFGNGSGATILSQFNGMSYDGKGNRLAVTANLPALPGYSGLTQYQYDSQDRLTQEVSARASGYTNTFGYDNAGNPTNFKGQTRSYNVQNQLSGSGFAYDVQGNPTTYKGDLLSFTANGEVTAFGTALTAGYTSDGVRAWKRDGSGSYTYFLYDGTTPLVELDATGSAIAVNTFGANGLLTRRSGTASVFYAFDERGTTAQRLDNTGTVLSSHLADAFGTMAFTTATTDPYAGFGAQHGYYTDSETGLVLCTFRYCDPSTGRWLTRDPIGYDGGTNLYAYVTNSPLMVVDSLGLMGNGTFKGGNGAGYGKPLAEAVLLAGGSKMGCWNYALGLLGDFLIGLGQTERNYGPNSTQSQQLKAGPFGDEIRRRLRVGNYDPATVFGPSAGPNPHVVGTFRAAQLNFWPLSGFSNGTTTQVGGFGFDATVNPGGDCLTITIENDASFDSLAYQVTNWRWHRFANGFGPMGTIHQTFTYREKIR